MEKAPTSGFALTGKRSASSAVDGTSSGSGIGNNVPPPSKRPSTNKNDAGANSCTTSTTPRIAPIRMFRTIDEKKNQTSTASSSSSAAPQGASQFSMSLREVLGFDGNRPTATIEWLVISNYLIDPEFLLEEVPELLSVPCTVVFYDSNDSPFTGWKRAVGDESIDFRCLRPSDPPGPTNPTGQMIHYGVHHTKMFLVGFSDGKLRVVVHTANLRYVDIHLKSQGLYLQDFPLKSPGSGVNTPTAFEKTLLDYLDTYKYTEPRVWTPGSEPGFLRGLIRRYDFSSACAVLIPSTPGYHRIDGKELRGHLKLRQAIIQNTTFNELAPAQSIICQFSSMGSLSEKYLRELQGSMDTKQARRILDNAAKDTSPLRIKMVYPSVEEIRGSIEGYRGGCSVPGSTKNVKKPFLRPLYHCWRPSADAGPNPLWKPRHVPHIKTYFQLSNDEKSLEYFCLTSHNMSMAAWGSLHSQAGSRHLFTRHWELGVFISPQLLQSDRMVPWDPNSTEQKSSDCVVPLPFSPKPVPYKSTDAPWAVDGLYIIPDTFGRRSAMQ